MSGNLLSIDIVMERLDCSRKTVYRLVKKGKLHASRVGRLLKFETRELDRFVAVNAVRHTPAKADLRAQVSKVLRPRRDGKPELSLPGADRYL